MDLLDKNFFCILLADVVAFVPSYEFCVAVVDLFLLPLSFSPQPLRSPLSSLLHCWLNVSFVPPLSNEIKQMSASVRFDVFRLVLSDGCDILCIALHPVLDTVMMMALFPRAAFQGNAVQWRTTASARRVLRRVLSGTRWGVVIYRLRSTLLTPECCNLSLS